MHLVIPTHPSLFWVICHPSRTFLLKELEQEPQNRLPRSPCRQTIPFLTSNPWPTAPVLARYKWVVPKPCACSTSMCVHGLSVVHAFAMAWGACLVFAAHSTTHSWPLVAWMSHWVFILCILLPPWVGFCLGMGLSFFNPTLAVFVGRLTPQPFRLIASAMLSFYLCLLGLF